MIELLTLMFVISVNIYALDKAGLWNATSLEKLRDLGATTTMPAPTTSGIP